MDGPLAPNGSHPAEVDFTARAHGIGKGLPGLASVPFHCVDHRADPIGSSDCRPTKHASGSGRETKVAADQSSSLLFHDEVFLEMDLSPSVQP